MKHLIIKGIGPDKPGIVSRISGMVTSNNGNIEESRMIRLGSEFSIIMMIAIPENSEKSLSDQLEGIDEIKFYLTETKKLPTHDSPTHIINLSGGDNEGIVHYISDKLTVMGINILEIITDTKNAPITGSAIFLMKVKISLDDENQINELSDRLNEIQSRLGLDITLNKI
tara:strand:+ start:2411 stop:2920 length:510 start_codon:yes stop_codon:yes gene_type:complete